MCGILGLLTPHADLPALTGRVRAVLPLLRHRGPDGSGIAVWSSAGGGAVDTAHERRALGPATGDQAPCAVVLGHTRLSIIDASAAASQPMASADGRYVLAFNGEIYNYIELRRELRAAGVHFRTTSDAEVLLEALVRWGDGALARLDGMFACALLDTWTGSVMFARDPVGMKPLYYARIGDELGFASEIRALLALMPVPRRIDPVRLHAYLATGISDGREGTLFAGVHTFPAASVAHWEVGGMGLSARRYWNSPPRRTEVGGEEVEHFRERFLESMAHHLRADVPVGALLSGGMDSSAVVSSMRRVLGPTAPIHTFTFVADSAAISEEPWADIVSTAANTVAHKVRMTPDDWASDFETLILEQGEPFGSIAIYAQRCLFQRAAEEGIRVTLDGQGSDETLGGYDSAVTPRMVSLLRAGDVAGAVGLRKGARDRGLRPLRSALGLMAPTPIRRLAQQLRRRDLAPLIDAEWARMTPSEANGPEEPWRPMTKYALGERIQLELEERLPILLRYADRNSMRWSIECRLPFLGPCFLDMALRLPEALLVDSGARGKALLKDAMRGIVPDQTLARPGRMGFAVPIVDWLQRTPGVDNLFADARRIPGVRRSTIEAFRSRLRGGHALAPPDAFLAWRAIVLAGWVRAFDVVV